MIQIPPWKEVAIFARSLAVTFAHEFATQRAKAIHEIEDLWREHFQHTESTEAHGSITRGEFGRLQEQVDDLARVITNMDYAKADRNHSHKEFKNGTSPDPAPERHTLHVQKAPPDDASGMHRQL